MTIFLSYLFYFVASTVSALQIRWLTKKKDLASTEQVLFTFQLIFILFLGSLTFPLFSRFYIAGNHLHLFLLALVCGICGIGANLFSIIAQKHLEAGVTTLVMNIYTPISIFLASILLHEGLGLLQIVGTILLLFGVVLVSQKHRVGRFSFDKYFLLTVLGGIFLGVLIVAERALMKATGFSAGVMLSWGFQALCLGIVALLTKSKHTYPAKEVVSMGLVRFFSATSWVTMVYILGNVSLASSVSTFKVVTVFVAAAIFLGEREDLPRKILGSLVAILGLLLMK
jgi:drug/metabolite transporter (DMT)-like permease